MFDILRDHAVKSVWCSPEQDNQIILAAARITKKGGDTVSTLVMTRRILLPEPKKYYHVYYVGQAHPTILGLLPKDPFWAEQPWINMTEAVNNLPLFCDVYMDNGLRIPLSQVYYQYTPDRGFIFCVEVKPSFNLNMDDNQVYLRLYTNAYYDSTEADGLTSNTRVVSKLIYAMTDVLEIQSIEAQWKAMGGATFSYVNGTMVDSLSPLSVTIGDYVECIIDLSVKRVIDFPLTGLPAFTSLRDQKQKYLLHYPETSDHVIDYVDDIDVYVLVKSEYRTYGRYVHRNLHETLRMVTHRDYSLLVDNVSNTHQSLVDWLTAQGKPAGTASVRLYIRHSGLVKKLPFENNRIFELYKLDDQSIVSALIGADAIVPYWKAAELENSAFIRSLDIDYAQIDIDLIEKSYGYNAISKVLADSPIYSNAAFGVPEAFMLPAGLQNNSTIYEYDEMGVLLGWSTHTMGAVHVAEHVDCSYIEGVVGLGSHNPAVTFGVTDIPVPSNSNYKVYMAYGENTIARTPWIDVTDSDMYEIADGLLKWTSADEDYILMVRTDEKFLAYEFSLLPVAGTLYFPLTEVSGGLHRELPVPMADLDIWLNGRSLIRGLDFTYEFPNIHIFNKDYLTQPAGSTAQRITVRFTGFCETADGVMVPAESTDDYGFIEHGVLSNNNRYDIRDDRVMSIYVKGALKRRDDVIFSEEHQGISVTNALNGQPYQVKERLIPLRGLTLSETDLLRQASLVIDRVVGSYLSLHLPQPSRNAPSAIQERHRLYSPFFAHLINDLQSGLFPREKLQKKLLDSDVIEICKTYTPLLKNDPLNEELGIDYRFVLIHPHQLDTTILLDVESYAFLKRVVQLYGKNLISLSGHLNINATGSN